MRSVEFNSIVSAADTAETTASLHQAERPPHRPVSVYPEQDFSALYRQIPHLNACIPEITLRIGVVEDATIFVQPGYDGVVLDRKRQVLRETCYYSKIWREQAKSGLIETDVPQYELDELFVSFDAAWFVYYHWLCFAIGPAALALPVLSSTVPIGFPDYADRSGLHGAAFTATVHEQAISATVPRSRTLLLPRGQYRIKRAYVLYVAHSQNTDITLHPLFNLAFQRIGARLAIDGPRTRIFVSRLLQGKNARIDPAEDARFQAMSAAHGFAKVYLEELDFLSQVRLFTQAEAVLGPHGGGLTNMLFARQGSKLIELSRDIDNNHTLRPWFYLIAAGGEHSYTVLNRDEGDFSDQRITACFSAMGLAA
jgi:Glycosyltransferase 61